MVTYGDGLADLDIGRLVEFHKSHGKLATVTTVRPVSRFGSVALDEDGAVKQFMEKPRSEGWISSGFFVFERGVFDYLSGDDCVLEREPLENWPRTDSSRHSGTTVSFTRWTPIANISISTNSGPPAKPHGKCGRERILLAGSSGVRHRRDRAARRLAHPPAAASTAPMSSA